MFYIQTTIDWCPLSFGKPMLEVHNTIFKNLNYFFMFIISLFEDVKNEMTVMPKKIQL